jgi:hypothetical protein
MNKIFSRKHFKLKQASKLDMTLKRFKDNFCIKDLYNLRVHGSTCYKMEGRN